VRPLARSHCWTNPGPIVAAPPPLGIPQNQWAEVWSEVLPPVPIGPDIAIWMVGQTVDIELVERVADTIALVDSVYDLSNNGPDTNLKLGLPGTIFGWAGYPRAAWPRRANTAHRQ
jgi:hypothetical protein